METLKLLLYALYVLTKDTFTRAAFIDDKGWRHWTFFTSVAYIFYAKNISLTLSDLGASNQVQRWGVSYFHAFMNNLGQFLFTFFLAMGAGYAIERLQMKISPSTGFSPTDVMSGSYAAVLGLFIFRICGYHQETVIAAYFLAAFSVGHFSRKFFIMNK